MKPCSTWSPGMPLACRSAAQVLATGGSVSAQRLRSAGGSSLILAPASSIFFSRPAAAALWAAAKRWLYSAPTSRKIFCTSLGSLSKRPLFMAMPPAYCAPKLTLVM